MPNMYAGTSIQVFPGGEATLSTPHSDVGAFLAYVGKFDSINFHAKDDDVREWRFNHEYDNWQDSLGTDSVRVHYHYGHCGMDPNGVLVIAMGRTWDNTFYADSTRMSFGDQRLRYLFLHGCDNLQMHFGQSPLRTFGTPNKGARMVFGFDSLTYDIDGLASGFFREWNTGKSFSQAWQDAALGIYSDHRPASTACGATAEEAQSRLWNERFFYGGAVSDDWYWWRWAGSVPLEIVIVITIPKTPGLDLRVARRPGEARTAAELGDRLGLRGAVLEARSPLGDEQGADRTPFEPRLCLAEDGSYRALIAEPRSDGESLDPIRIKEIADQQVASLELRSDVIFDGLTATYHGGASRAGDAVEERVRDYTAHYRQVYEDVPVARGGDGQLSVTVDPLGSVCSITDRTVSFEDAIQAEPGRDSTDRDVDAALDAAENALRESLECQTSLDFGVERVADSTDIGYRVDRDAASLIARRVVEVRTGRFTIRKLLEVNI